MEIEARSDGAVAGLRSARQEVEQLGQSADHAGSSLGNLGGGFQGLTRMAPGAGRSVSLVEQSTLGAARAFGLSATQMRLMSVAVRTLTGALGPVTIALGALAAAMALIQRHQEQARTRAEELAQAQEQAAASAERHRERLVALRQDTDDAARVMRDMQIEIMRVVDEERARAMVAEDVAEIAATARLVEVNSLEDLVAASEETTAARERLAVELAQEEIRMRRLVEQVNQATFAADRERHAQRVVEAAERMRLIREELDLIAQQENALRRMFPLMRQLRQAEEEADEARPARIRSIREEADASDALLLKIKEEAEAIAELERIKQEARADHSIALKQQLLDEVEAEAEAERLKAENRAIHAREAKSELLRIEEELERERQRIAEEALRREEERQRQRMRMAMDAAGLMASAAKALANRSFKEAVGSIGGQLQAEGIQRAFQGGARALLGDPAGASLAGIGAGMIAAGTSMRALAGGGSTPAVQGGTVAPTAAPQTNQTANINIALQEGVVSDPQANAQRISDALSDVAQRGLWPQGASA